MEQTNAIITLKLEQLNFPLRTMFARQGHCFVALFRSVPADVTGLFVRVFKENGAYFDINGHEHPGGEWTVRIPAYCFPLAGDFRYEVHARAADDEPAALGEGRLSVASFSTTTTPATPGEVQMVTQMPCQGGGYVQVLMKWDGFEWMPEAVHTATANEGTEND